MVAAPVRELGGSYINNTFPCPFGNLMNKTCEILIGIPETMPFLYPIRRKMWNVEEQKVIMHWY